jgi:NAD(P)-dependent dehydrogenase (short-subunit alcohol dehydrogenase family)
VSKFTFDLSGKVAIVTGGTRGLGYGMVDTFAEHGANVVIAARTKEDCEKVAQEMREKGVKSLACHCDVSSQEQIENLIQKTVETFGKVDILVNNAGIAIGKSVFDISEEEWDRVIDVDLKAIFFVTQAAAKVMKEQKSGVIINIASLAGVVINQGLSPYSAAKAGVIHLTKAQAIELARYNIRVNCVAPAYVETDLNRKSLSDEKYLKSLLDPTPMKRLGTIDEIAGPVLFLASDAASYMTGATIVVDGGRSIY